MKELGFWLEQIAATILFFALMALIYVLMGMMFPDPSVW